MILTSVSCSYKQRALYINSDCFWFIAIRNVSGSVSGSLPSVLFDPLISWTSLFPVWGPLWLNWDPLHSLVPLCGMDFLLQSVPSSSLVVYPHLSPQNLSFLSWLNALSALLKGSCLEKCYINGQIQYKKKQWLAIARKRVPGYPLTPLYLLTCCCRTNIDELHQRKVIWRIKTHYNRYHINIWLTAHKGIKSAEEVMAV